MKIASIVLLACLCASCSTTTVAVPYVAMADPAGCRVEQITTEPNKEYQVQGVSRDGKRLAYTSDRGKDADGNRLLDVYILDLATGEKTLLPKAVNNSGHFSPDGNYLVVAAYDDSGRTEILEIEIATRNIEVIASHEQWDWLPSYSPDGQFIVFNSYRHEGQADIYLYERATQKLDRLTSFSGYDAHAQFSADGKRILFNRQNSQSEDGREDFDLYVYDLESATETRLTDGPFDDSYPAFAPDGQHIVFSLNTEAGSDKLNLYIRAPDGTVTQLTDGDWKDSYAYWTPDGAYIYFNSDRSGVTNVHRISMRAKGSGFVCAGP